jgi:chitinase
MIWAVDLDNGQLDALRTISDPSIIGNEGTTFDLVDVRNIFPTEYLPPNGYAPKYGLVNFGGSLDSTNMDPSDGGFGFFLISGDSHVASPLTKRDNEPDPFEFLDCHGTAVALQSGISKARVACFSDDVEGCFRVMEQGIGGTLVELPNHVGHLSLALVEAIGSLTCIDFLVFFTAICKSRLYSDFTW